MCRHTSTHTMALHRVTLILLLALFASFVGPVPLTYAATISVACADVAGLVAAITTANTNGVDDVISLAAGCTYTLTTSDNNAFGSNGLPVIVPDGNLTIQGNGATIRRDPASPFFRLLCVSGGGGQGTQTSLTISGLTMSGGDSEGEGGAIYARYTDLLITESTFSSNRSAYSGGAIDTMDANGRISASTFSANSAREGGAVAITVDGGGTIDIINSTFSGNLAIDDGGAIYDTGGLTSLTHSTIAGNTSDSDSDGIGDAAVRGSGVSLYSTIIAENIDLSPVDIFPDIVGSVTSNGYNIIGVDDPPTLATNTGDHVGTSAAPINPLLGALTDNGGPTLTRALLPGSPALDAGDPTLPPLPTTDQRGTGFPRVVGVIDIGAFEAAPAIAVYLGATSAGTPLTNGQATAVAFGTTLVGTPVLRSFTIRNTGSANLSLGALTLPAGYALVGTFPGGPVAPSSEVSFQVQLNAAATGTVSGTLSFVNGAAAQTPFIFPLSGSVTSTSIVIHKVYMPLVIVPMPMPDLLVTTISVSPAKSTFAAGEPVVVRVVVTNQGTAPAGPFWVDLSVNPSQPPQINDLWHTICGIDPCVGVAWAVRNGLAPGESITLTTLEGFDPQRTYWLGWLPSGTTTLYAYADSWNTTGSTGVVQERDETNNRGVLDGLSVTGVNPPAPPWGIQPAQAPVEQGLPDRVRLR